MKTFKLRKLEILEHDKQMDPYEIKLLDGLIINREDEHDQWLVEAYIDKAYEDYFIEKQNQEIMIQATITKDTNEPATFITNIQSINKIGNQINVLLLGKIVDKGKSIVEDLLTKLVKEGYEGLELIREFKKSF
ncbi:MULTISPECIES: YwpF-like family protein [Oceanobacillus]|uniref:YwpF-like protein n=1 Tax=Oceanobacillus kimchii TaxID=746691 RepID=A0ABQ5TG22_9BACI|nr:MULTISPECIES: YwpF-like family protein [Oceanobacillus]MBT2598876.1 YwpF-like family protein [Oceanobacillus sp. ISL-74]MBT2651795.1 YwpF-like family protein [Oceanobacillus sp. ISL-73]OEH54502.1 hypothetical protein AQ616_12145 [Oceanobacillus sp. E9]GLO65829.1 hypothetical protein MACH08_16130 [Oceanobacillus kimchii]